MWSSATQRNLLMEPMVPLMLRSVFNWLACVLFKLLRREHGVPDCFQLSPLLSPSSSARRWRDWWNNQSIFRLLEASFCSYTAQVDCVSDRSLFLCASLRPRRHSRCGPPQLDWAYGHSTVISPSSASKPPKGRESEAFRLEAAVASLRPLGKTLALMQQSFQASQATRRPSWQRQEAQGDQSCV